MTAEIIPYETVIFVCTNRRANGERIACGNTGRVGEKIRDDLKLKVESLGLKGRVRVCASGCMDLCEKGPNAMVFDALGRGVLHSGLRGIEEIPLRLSSAG
jgi:NADH:ubiquinone oxidoreductase subunit E